MTALLAFKLIFPALLGSMARADTIYTCKLRSSTSITWEESGILSKAGLKSKAHDNDEDMTVVLVLKKNGATLKGNADTVPLKRVGVNAFTEETGAGNINLWTLLEKTEKHPAVLIQHKAYSLFGAATYTSAFTCD